MTRAVTAAGVSRMSRTGLTAMTTEQALALFDTALAADDHAHLVLAPLDYAALRRQAADNQLTPLFGDLVSRPSRPVTAAGGISLARRLADAAEGERDEILLDVVRAHIATALGHNSAERVDPDRAMKDLGFDSLIAVDFRNRLSAATGLRLPATLAFNYPTPAAVADYLKGQLLDDRSPDEATVLAELDRMESVLRKASESTREQLTVRLRQLLTTHAGATHADTAHAGTAHAGTERDARDIASATDDEVFDLIDNELGIA